MPPRSVGKRQNANAHNARHENGLTPPGKRVQKQKSNGHINRAAEGNGKLSPSSNTSSTPHSVPHDAGEIDTDSDKALDGRNGLSGAKSMLNGNTRSSSSASSESRESLPMYTGSNTSKVESQQHRRIDINASKDASSQGINALRMVSTILRACPLGDTIAILIVLLQVPSTFLMIIHCLFAALTFVTPSGPIASLPSITDFLQSSTGTPSLATTIAADILSLLVWVCLWTPAQNFTIDLAQAVVAIALGGGYNQGDGSKTAGMCFLVIAASHIAERKGIRQAGLSTSRNGDSAMPLPSDLLSTTRSYSQWMRNLLAIHIFTQGLVRWVRRYIYRREMDNGDGSSKKVDTEAAAGRDQLEDDPSTHDGMPSGSGLSPTEVSSPSTIQGAKDVKDKVSSGKRRKRQGLLVRSQQPLWAALASTKVVVLKEYEQTQASREATVSKSMKDSCPNEKSFDLEHGRIWITHVGSTDLKFSTSSFETRESISDNCETNGFITTGVDKSKPFYLRINTAEWASTRICKVSGAGKSICWSRQ